jgi:hypothetical protein
MAADTALTIDSMNTRRSIEDRAFFGLVKLLPVRKLQAGISYWGWTTMPPSSEKGIWMDWWLSHFLEEQRSNYETISDLAKLLENKLQELIPPLSEKELELMPRGNGGIHLAGFIDEDGRKMPCLWRVGNGVNQASGGETLDPHKVNAVSDCPPQKFVQFKNTGQAFIVRDGDIEAYASFFDNYLKSYIYELREKMGIALPLPTIDFRGEFLRVQIRFISELYDIGGIAENGILRQICRGIGGEVTTLTIAEEGIHRYYTQ